MHVGQFVLKYKNKIVGMQIKVFPDFSIPFTSVEIMLVNDIAAKYFPLYPS